METVAFNPSSEMPITHKTMLDYDLKFDNFKVSNPVNDFKDPVTDLAVFSACFQNFLHRGKDLKDHAISLIDRKIFSKAKWILLGTVVVFVFWKYIFRSSIVINKNAITVEVDDRKKTQVNRG